MKRIILIISTLLLSGCALTLDNMENITIYTTTYPLEYLTTYLYGENSTIKSIYPNEIVQLSDKLLKDYSKSDLYVYNGLSKEKDYAVTMLNYNKNLKIVDAAMGMEHSYEIEELWLNPSNFLMLSLNIKDGMKEYITTSYLKEKIENNYNKLKILISEIDAEIKLTVEIANKNVLLIGNDTLLFFEKYGLNIISVDKDTVTNKITSELKDTIKNNNLKYIYIFEDDELDEEVENILNSNNITTLYLDRLSLLSEEQKDNGEDYITIMEKNIELIKKELYE